MKAKALLLACILTAVFTFGAHAAAKTVFIPNEFTTLGLDWDMARSYESANFVIFWGSIVGADPLTAADTTLRFNPATVCATLEAVYAKFITEIQFCSDDPSKNLGKYKCIIMMNNTFSSPNGPTGWAFGGTYQNTIGAMWVHPQATADGVVISHEFAHSLQGMISIQENISGGGFVNWEPAGFFWECHANYMRAQMYTAAAFAYDMPRWLATSMFHWSSTRHHYDSFRPLFVLQETDGIGLVNRLWKESLNREHPLITLRRLLGWNQAQLNDFMYGYAKREVASDYPVNGFGTVIKTEMTRLKNQEPHYLWRQYAMLNRIDGYSDRFVVPDEFAPQDYGYNIIPLYPQNTALPVCVKFKGHTEANSFAGWRYGIVSVTTAGAPRYQAFYPDNEKEFAFQPFTDESSWYLVVSGAPVTHTSYVWEPGWPKIKRYPYEIRLSNAVPEGWQAAFRADIRAKYAGHAHPNGGGWTANSATVADTAYVGPRVVVLGNSNIGAAVSISGTAWVENAAVSGNVMIDGNARIRGGNISQNAQVKGNAILYNCTVSGSVIAKDDTFDWGSTFSGASVIGGDAEITSATTDGVYLQCPHGNNGRAENDGKGITDISNIDVNAVVTPFADPDMQFTGGCVVATATNTPSASPAITPTFTASSTATRSQTPTQSCSRTNTAVNTATYTRTPSPSTVPTQSVTPTGTPSIVPTASASAASTSSVSPTATYSRTQTQSVTPQSTSTKTETRTATSTSSVQQTSTSTSSAQITVTSSVSPIVSYTMTPTFTDTRTPSETATAQVPSNTRTVTSVPSFTRTSTLTPGPSQPTPTATATPDAGYLALDDVLIYPNPYYSAGDLNISMDIKGTAEIIMIRIYSAAFRLVAVESKSGVFTGISSFFVPARNLSRLASGTYYVSVSAASRSIKARSGAQALIVLRK